LVGPRIHDIADLVGHLLKAGVIVPDNICAAAFLSEYAVAARYPGLDEPVEAEDLQAAIEKAREVIVWVESLIVPNP
jgi:HEPN domain-containing protein